MVRAEGGRGGREGGEGGREVGEGGREGWRDIIREEGSIFAPQRIPFCMALGEAACTVGRAEGGRGGREGGRGGMEGGRERQ